MATYNKIDDAIFDIISSELEKGTEVDFIVTRIIAAMFFAFDGADVDAAVKQAKKAISKMG